MHSSGYINRQYTCSCSDLAKCVHSDNTLFPTSIFIPSLSIIKFVLRLLFSAKEHHPTNIKIFSNLFLYLCSSFTGCHLQINKLSQIFPMHLPSEIRPCNSCSHGKDFLPVLKVLNSYLYLHSFESPIASPAGA